MLIQLVFLVIFAAALSVVWRRATQNVISRREAFAWSALWIAAAGIILLPQTTTVVAHFFGIGRGADFILYGAVILLFVLVFKLFIALDSMERKLTEFVRRDALKDFDKN